MRNLALNNEVRAGFDSFAVESNFLIYCYSRIET